MKTKKCKICGKEFKPKTNNQKYCEKDCYKVKRRLENKEYKKKNKEDLIKKNKNYREKNKSKINKKLRIYRKNNKDKLKKYSKNYYEKNKDKLKKDMENYKKKYPNRRKIEGEAYRNIKIKKGTLCEICKKEKATERHHEDYNKPLNVKLLCKGCHSSIHRGHSNENK